MFTLDYYHTCTCVVHVLVQHHSGKVLSIILYTITILGRLLTVANLLYIANQLLFPSLSIHYAQNNNYVTITHRCFNFKTT